MHVLDCKRIEVFFAESGKMTGRVFWRSNGHYDCRIRWITYGEQTLLTTNHGEIVTWKVRITRSLVNCLSFLSSIISAVLNDFFRFSHKESNNQYHRKEERPLSILIVKLK